MLKSFAKILFFSSPVNEYIKAKMKVKKTTQDTYTSLNDNDDNNNNDNNDNNDNKDNNDNTDENNENGENSETGEQPLPKSDKVTADAIAIAVRVVFVACTLQPIMFDMLSDSAKNSNSFADKYKDYFSIISALVIMGFASMMEYMSSNVFKQNRDEIVRIKKEVKSLKSSVEFAQRIANENRKSINEHNSRITNNTTSIGENRKTAESAKKAASTAQQTANKNTKSIDGHDTRITKNSNFIQTNFDSINELSEQKKLYKNLEELKISIMTADDSDSDSV